MSKEAHISALWVFKNYHSRYDWKLVKLQMKRVHHFSYIQELDVLLFVFCRCFFVSFGQSLSLSLLRFQDLRCLFRLKEFLLCKLIYLQQWPSIPDERNTMHCSKLAEMILYLNLVRCTIFPCHWKSMDLHRVQACLHLVLIYDSCNNSRVNLEEEDPGNDQDGKYSIHKHVEHLRLG